MHNLKEVKLTKGPRKLDSDCEQVERQISRKVWRGILWWMKYDEVKCNLPAVHRIVCAPETMVIYRVSKVSIPIWTVIFCTA